MKRKQRKPLKNQVTLEMVLFSHDRKEKGYTQAQLSRLTHYERSAISSYEIGRRLIPTEFLDKFRNLPKRN